MYVIHTIPPAHVPMRNQKYLAIPKSGNQSYIWTTSWADAQTFPTAYHARNMIADVHSTLPSVSLHISRSMVLSEHIIEELLAL